MGPYQLLTSPASLVWKRRLALIPLAVAIVLFLSYTYSSTSSASHSRSTQEALSAGDGIRYKTVADVIPTQPIVDNFPIQLGLDTLPSIAPWNRPPAQHVEEKTPLFIGFTRNWPLLQQCVLSYITAGWPPGDIYVVDNTGTFKSNFPPGKLTLQNPFYLDVERLEGVFGVNVISTPTLLSFAQLQNFYIFTALERGWGEYFVSHSQIDDLENEADFG